MPNRGSSGCGLAWRGRSPRSEVLVLIVSLLFLSWRRLGARACQPAREGVAVLLSSSLLPFLVCSGVCCVPTGLAVYFKQLVW